MLFSQGPSFGFSGQPVLIAWAHDWGSPSAGVLDAIRDQLRSLGVTLWVASESGSFCLPLSEEAAALQQPPPVLGALPPPRAARANTGMFTLMLFDGGGNLRFQFSRVVLRSLAETLLHVLHVASRSVSAARSLTVPSEAMCQAQAGRRSVIAKEEAVILGLIGALSLLMLNKNDAGRPAPGSRKPPRKAEFAGAR